jgi:thiol-disulfide isomerase/thioredoxin
MDFFKGNTSILLIVIVVIGILIMLLCNTRSTFGANSGTEKISVKPGISDDSVLIFYAPWCGHCKRSMKEFEKAVASGQGKVILVDATDDSNKDLIGEYNVQGFPTIIKGNREKYTGSRTADEIIEFSQQ